MHMKRAYAVSQYGKCYEQYCKEYLPQQAKEIFDKAEQYYKEFVKMICQIWEKPDGKNMLDWFTILSFYEASDHKLDGEVLLNIKRKAADKMRFLGKFVNGNKSRWPYKMFEKTYVNFNRMKKSIRIRANGWTPGM